MSMVYRLMIDRDYSASLTDEWIDAAVAAHCKTANETVEPQGAGAGFGRRDMDYTVSGPLKPETIEALQAELRKSDPTLNVAYDAVDED